MNENEKLKIQNEKYKHALEILAEWPSIDAYKKIKELRKLGDPQWIGEKSIHVSLAAARRFAGSLIKNMNYVDVDKRIAELEKKENIT